MKENNFFKRKNLFMYQKGKMPHRLLPLTEQMFEGFASGKYGIVTFPDLQGAFNAVWRKRAPYKLHKAGITNNLL